MFKGFGPACLPAIFFFVIMLAFPARLLAAESPDTGALPTENPVGDLDFATFPPEGEPYATSEPSPVPSEPAAPAPMPTEPVYTVPDLTPAPSPAKGLKREKKPKPGKWKKKNQKFYYVRHGGKKAKGKTVIGNKTYCFDKKGVQHTGWQKVKGNYYFFKIQNGKGGYMVKSKKIDGVSLKKNGTAKLNKDSRSKLYVLVKANKIVEKATKPAMKKSQKLRKCFDYSIKEFQYRGSPTFHNSKHWDRNYALNMFDDGHGSCYAYGAAFAYLANAIGCEKNYAVSSGGHGWSEVDGKIYDISWHLIDKRYSYFGLDPKLSGVDGRPKFSSSRKYVKKI